MGKKTTKSTRRDMLGGAHKKWEGGGKTITTARIEKSGGGHSITPKKRGVRTEKKSFLG